MTDEQIIKSLRCWTGKAVKDKECAECSFGEIVDAAEKRIKELADENAVLRERLERAEIPCHVGDTLYEPFCDTMIREWVVESIHVGLIGVTVNCHRKDDYKWHDSFAIRKHYNDFGEKGRVCFTREAAEARLAEQKGEKE